MRRGELDGVLSVSNLIDLAAWLPFWITGALETPPFAQPVFSSSRGDNGTGFLRAIRLLRVLRVFKMSKHSLSIHLFTDTLRRSMPTMAVLTVCGTIAVIIFGSLIWLIEQPGSVFVTPQLLAITGRGDMQGFCFATIPSCLWWVVTTITTVRRGLRPLT